MRYKFDPRDGGTFFRVGGGGGGLTSYLKWGGALLKRLFSW